MESQHQDQNGQHQIQQLQHQQQDHHHQNPDHQPVHQPNTNSSRGPQKGSSQSRASSRTRRLSCSSFSGVINFGDSPATTAGSHARTPTNRGRARDASSFSSSSHSHSHSYSKSQPEISTAVAADIFSPFSPPAMENNGDEPAAPQPDKATTKQQSPPQHSSFTFATPQNPRNMPGRKRARTLEYPQSAPEPQSPGDDAKVKGGHSLRKRVRIDYAQMAEHEDDEHAPPAHATDGTMEITVSGTRSVRKRRATADPNHEEDDTQSATAAVPLARKKPRTSEIQRTVSPLPQRRPYQKRKSTVAATITLDSPDRLPSDTELKDTIEVGAPLVAQSISSSSQAHSSETASNVSGHSPSKLINHPQVSASQSEVTRTKPFSAPNGTTGKSGLKEETGTPTQESIGTAEVAIKPPTEITRDSLITKNQNLEDSHTSSTPSQAPKQNGVQDSSEASAIAPATAIEEALQTGHDIKRVSVGPSVSPMNLRGTKILRATSEAALATQPPSSSESIDSDTTEIVAPKLIPSAAHETTQQAVHAAKMANKGKGKQAIEVQASQEEPEETKQDTPKLGLRPRRQRTSRLAENTVAAQEDDHAPPPPKEKVTPSGRKSDDKLKATDRSAISEETGPSSPDTPRRRGPGRPPKNRVLPELETAKAGPSRAKERRASRTATRLEHPRPVRSHPPRDFSFLTPYLDSREMYPEITQDQESGMPTPLETPNLQPSDAAADEQAEDASSQGHDKDLGSQDAQTTLDGEAVSNAPTPGAIYDAPTPATAADSATPSRNASPEPMVESMRKPKSRRQYAFPRIRSPTEFINHLDGYKNMSDEDLSNLLTVSANALEAWQDEWKQQKAIVDDEDNAVRRRAHDLAFVAREARDLAKSTGSVTIEKRDFEVKGIRADRVQENKADFPLSNPEAYERRQDMVAAQAWGFEWDPRPSMIGKQDPIAQREGLQNTRLRNRPKLSQRAAEAAGDEPVGIVPGKRTRKPRLLSDESKDPSRAPTPVEPAKPKRRRRRNLEAELVESDNETPDQQPEEPKPEPERPAPPPAAPAAPPAKKPYTGKKRGPKPKAEREALARAAAEREAAEREAAEREAAEQAAAEKAAQEAAAKEAADAEAAAAAASMAAQQEQNEAASSQPKTRKRRRTAAGAEIQPQDIPTASIEDIQPDGPANRQAPHENELPAPKRQRARKPKVEIPTTTFYSTAGSIPTNEDTATPLEEKRPSTASSTSSMRTNESTYSFRQRPRKNYSELAGPAKEVPTEGRPKRTRKRANVHDEPEPTSYPANLAPAPPTYPEGPQYSMANHGYHVQPPSVLAPPFNNPFLPPAGGHPGPLLAPSPMRPGHVAAPPVVGGNPFSAPSNLPIEAPTQQSQSPRRKPLRIKIINRRGQTATPQPDGPQQGAPHPHSYQSMQQAPNLAPLQPPPSFHAHNNGYDPHIYGGPSITGSVPGQVMFPVNANASLGAPMSMPPVLHHGPSLPPLSNIQSQGSVTGSRANSKPPGSGRATPAPSSAASSTGGGVPGGDEMSEKDYASMTKSEKMSASMKARWANGSMRQAVNKRKETLARKKQSQADKSVASVTPTPQPEIAPPTQIQTQMQGGPITPILLQPGSAENLTPMALPPPHQQQTQPPPHGYGSNMHMMGGLDPHSAGGMVLPPPSAVHAGPMPPHMMDGPAYPPPPRREPARQNPFLDHGYADRGPRLPFLPNSPEDMGDGRYDHWGPPRPQQ